MTKMMTNENTLNYIKYKISIMEKTSDKEERLKCFEIISSVFANMIKSDDGYYISKETMDYFKQQGYPIFIYKNEDNFNIGFTHNDVGYLCLTANKNMVI